MGTGEKISARETQNKQPCKHRTGIPDTDQDGLVSAASAAHRGNGNKLLSKPNNIYFIELMQQLYCSSFGNNGNYTPLVLSLDNTVISVCHHSSHD